MTTIDGMPITPELVSYLKKLSPEKENDDFCAIFATANHLSELQDHFCRKIGQVEPEERPEIITFLETLVEAKDMLNKLYKLLPIIKN